MPQPLVAAFVVSALLLVARGTARAEDEATESSFVHTASEAPPPVLLDLRLIAGLDWEMTDRRAGGYGLRVGGYWSPWTRTRLQLWASETGGASLCADGRATNPPDPFLGCYPLASTALGMAARQGLLKSGPVELGVEAGLSARTVPASILVVGLGERLTLEASASFSAVTLYARAGAGLSEIPTASEVDGVIIVGAGIEGAVGRFRPSFELTVDRIATARQNDTALAPLLSLGLGVVI